MRDTAGSDMVGHRYGACRVWTGAVCMGYGTFWRERASWIIRVPVIHSAQSVHFYSAVDVMIGYYAPRRWF